MTSPYTRTCEGACGQTRPLARFPRTKRGRGRTCSACVAASRRKRTPRQRRAARDARYRREYGITLAEYNAMGRSQGWRCAICDRPPYPEGARLVVDHDHDCGTVRALLCSPCNSALGLMGDKPERLESAARYLSAYADLRSQVAAD